MRGLASVKPALSPKIQGNSSWTTAGVVQGIRVSDLEGYDRKPVPKCHSCAARMARRIRGGRNEPVISNIMRESYSAAVSRHRACS